MYYQIGQGFRVWDNILCGWLTNLNILVCSDEILVQLIYFWQAFIHGAKTRSRFLRNKKKFEHDKYLLS